MQFLVVIWICSVVLATALGSQRRATLGGLFFGVFLGPLGIIVACLLDERFNCPQCGARLNGDKRHAYPVCPYCKTELVWTQYGPRPVSMKRSKSPLPPEATGTPRFAKDDKDDLKSPLNEDRLPPKFDEWGQPLQEGGYATLIKSK